MSASTMWVTPNCLLIECIINPSVGVTSTINPFGQQKEMQNKKVVAMESFSNQDQRFSPISTINPVVNQSVFQTSFLTLYRASVPAHKNHSGQMFPASNEGLYYDKIPLCRLRLVTNMDQTAANTTSASNMMFRIKPAEMSWTKSYVWCSPSTAISQAQSALFLVHYLNQEEDWEPYM